MKHNNTGVGFALPLALKKCASMFKQGNQKKTSGFSGSMALVSSAFVLCMQLLSGRAEAQIATYTGSGGTSTTITYATNSTGTVLQKTGFGSASPCGSGGLSGMTNNGVTTFATTNARIYFKITPNTGYVLNLTNITAKFRRSGSGLQKVRFAYSLDNGSTWVNDNLDKAPNNSSCGSSATTHQWYVTGGGSLPTAVTATNGIIVAFYPYDPISSGGVIQINNCAVDGTVTAVSSCSGTPTAGTASATPTSFCGSGAASLSLSGASGGSGITYQWQSSPTIVGSDFTDIVGATNTTHSAATVTSTTYYRAITTCTTSALSAASTTATVTIVPIPSAGTILGASVVNNGTTSTFTNATGGGVWSCTPTSIATVGSATGIVSGVNTGIAVLSYTVTSGGCTGITTKTITVAPAGTLAVYVGSGGSSTSVIPVQPNSTVGALTATGFGSNSPCGSGGLSGITVNTVHATYSATGPKVYFQILPTPGHQLNVTGLSAITRESSTGPTQARLAYSLDGGATWTNEGTDQAQATGGSCGASSNNFSWTGGLTLLGITSTTNGILVAVYPFAPGASTGTFQVNRILVNGSVTDTGTCTGTVGGAAVAGIDSFCGSGSTTISLTGGSTGAGISYQWQSSPDNTVFTNIAGATNTTYATGTVTTTTYYRVTTYCLALDSSYSSVDSVVILAIPTVAPITGSTLIYIGTPNALSSTTPGGIWTSTLRSFATVDSFSGVVTGILPGQSLIKYSVTSGGCTGVASTTVAVVFPGTIAAYLGWGGSSTDVLAFPNVTVTPLTEVGFGYTSPCGSGGISGLTNNGVTTFSTGNANVYFSITPDAGYYVDVTEFHATLRRSNSGIQKVRMAYSTDGGSTWNDDGVDQAPDNLSCGNDTTNFTYAATLPTGITSSGVIVALYPYDPIATGGTIQVNSIDIVGASTLCATATGITGGSEVCIGAALPLTGASTGGTWIGSNDGIATIGSVSGIVTGVSEGTMIVTYTVTSPCGVTSTTATITVNQIPMIYPIGGTTTICVGSTGQLTNDNEEGTWSSNTTSVAEVDGTGVITGVSEGTATITYTVTNEFGCSLFETTVVTVNPTPVVAAISGDATVCASSTITLSNTTAGGVWSSSDDATATVGSSDGIVTGVAAGTATISYIVTNAFGCADTATHEVEVTTCGGRGVAPSAVSENAAVGAELFPNPATTTINIRATEKVNIAILTIEGKVVMEAIDATQVNVSNLANGLYIVRIYTTQGNTLVKTVKFTKN